MAKTTAECTSCKAVVEAEEHRTEVIDGDSLCVNTKVVWTCTKCNLTVNIDKKSVDVAPKTPCSTCHDEKVVRTTTPCPACQPQPKKEPPTTFPYDSRDFFDMVYSSLGLFFIPIMEMIGKAVAHEAIATGIAFWAAAWWFQHQDVPTGWPENPNKRWWVAPWTPARRRYERRKRREDEIRRALDAASQALRTHEPPPSTWFQ